MLTYDRAAYIGAAIQSVRAQTYQHWQLTIIDDGSTDDTEAIIAAIKDGRITYVRHETNKGLFTRRSESLRYANGIYTAILDSDDVWQDPTKLAAQVKFLKTHPDCVLVGTFTNLINADGAAIGTQSFATTDTAIRNKILIRNQFTHSSVLMQTAALKKTVGYQPTLAEDLALFLQLGEQGKLANLPEFFTDQRIHSGSTNDYGSAMAEAVHAIIQEYKNSYPQYYLAYLVSIVRLIWARLRGRTR